MASTARLLLTPTDVLMFRDTRPFGQVLTGTGSLLPTPRAAAGAVRTWALRTLFPEEFEKLRGKRTTKQVICETFGEKARWITEATFAGPYLYKDEQVYLPVPLNVVKTETQRNGGVQTHIHLMSPVRDAPPGWSAPSGAPQGFQPVWAKGPVEAEPLEARYVTAGELATLFLARKSAPKLGQLVKQESLWQGEPRIGIAIDPAKNAVKEQYLYGSAFLRCEQRVGFLVEVSASCDDLLTQLNSVVQQQPWLRFGGEGKTAYVQVMEDEPVSTQIRADLACWPPSSGRFLTYLATPGLFSGGQWFPTEFAKWARLVSAVVGEPFAVPGWDIAHNLPLKTRYAVPAGAVYFWEATEKPDSLPDPHGTSLSDDTEEAQAGWGICLRGEWDYV